MLTRVSALAGLMACCSAVFAIPVSAGAQTTAQFPIQFDFLTPGARSMALGGAYIGAADDATAAFTNPAGLAFFKQRQFSMEVRLRSLATPFLAGGRISGTPTGRGEDTIAVPIYDEDVDSVILPSFIGAVFPLRSRPVSLAFYRHDLVNVDNAFFSRGPFERITFFGTTDDANRELPIGGSRSVRIATYGGSVAWAWNQFAIGGGVSLSTFRLTAGFTKFGLVSNIFSAPDTTLTIATATQDGDDVAISGNFGALWNSEDERLAIGVTFRRGPEFSFSQHDHVVGDLDIVRAGRFKVPDLWAVGILWTPATRTRILIDYDRVQYSQLKQDFIDIQALASGRPEQLAIDNANELHGGVEYRWQVRSRNVAARGGAWWDPDHSVRYVATAAHDDIDTLYTATLPGGQDAVHYTFGGAIALSNWVIDAAADLSSRSKSGTVSVLVRF